MRNDEIFRFKFAKFNFFRVLDLANRFDPLALHYCLYFIKATHIGFKVVHVHAVSPVSICKNCFCVVTFFTKKLRTTLIYT